jgi:5'(3')-deoxyribonucleotidase
MKFLDLKDIANKIPKPNSFKHYHKVAEDGRIVKGVNTTADVDTNSISKEAGKFGFKVDKDGRPPTLSKKVKGSKTNVLFNLGMAESVEERSLTKGEEKDKEKYVKGMKKNKKDFKKRYGDDAEAVMYATATKMAKESKELASASEIYVDMDGVLVDFFGEWTKMMGVSDWKQIKNVDQALQKIRDKDDFWLSLKPTKNAGKLLAIIKKIKGEYNILSAPLAGDPKAEPHKREWIAKYLKVFPPKKVIITADKQAYAKQPDGTPNILIDDFGQNVSKWEAAGGVGFKHKDHKFERTATQLADYISPERNEEIAEILGFATKRPKTATIKKKRPPEEDSVQDKIKKRRALARQIGTDKAFRSDALKKDESVDEGELIPNPKNTSLVKSDADYDFIKLGTNMANIKDIDPNDMNPDDPDIMVQFYGGDKERSYMLKQLKRLGYDVQDADGYKDAQYDEQYSDDPNAYRLIIGLKRHETT